jgi:diguanylate cyclase (GGDEF)-like protein
VIRSYAAKIYIEQSRYDDALQLLSNHYDEVRATKYAHLMSEYDSALAMIHLKKGNYELARRYAADTLQGASKVEYIGPIVSAYQVLYLEAKHRGDIKSALAYHEQYAAADKGYIDDVSAQQLAYQRVKHQADADKLKIETLNKQNEVLQLKSSLADKAVETSRLYILVLVMGLAIVVALAYRTKRSQLHFRNLSRLDGLTGIFNRPYFVETATRVLDEGRTQGKTHCVILCDLDHFKKINDTGGHATGDAVLRKTAAAFQAHLRKNDIVGRLGGEEFGILLVDCDIATAQQRCEQLRQALEKVIEIGTTAEIRLSGSFGIAVTSTSGHDLQQLLADADAALYRAKLTGRNRVERHEKAAPGSAVSNAGFDRLTA